MNNYCARSWAMHCLETKACQRFAAARHWNSEQSWLERCGSSHFASSYFQTEPGAWWLTVAVAVVVYSKYGIRTTSVFGGFIMWIASYTCCLFSGWALRPPATVANPHIVRALGSKETHIQSHNRAVSHSLHKCFAMDAHRGKLCIRCLATRVKHLESAIRRPLPLDEIEVSK